MKLRIKLQGASSARTERLALPQAAPTLGDLEDALLGLGLPQTAQPVVSLNKRDPINGTSDTPLRELGVCSGDLLWLLSPAPPDAAVATPLAAPAPAPAGPPAAEPSGPKRARPAEDAPKQQLQQQQQQQQATQQQRQGQQHKQAEQAEGRADQGKQAVVVGGEQAQGTFMQGDGMDVEKEQEHPVEPVPPSQLVPTYLLRTLRASPQTAAAGGPAGLLLLAAHAAMLEMGFVPSWALSAAAAGSRGAPSVVADGTASGAGAATADDATASSSAFEVPASARTSSSICRIEYHLVPPSKGSSAWEGGSSGDGGDGTMDVDQGQPAGVLQQEGAQQQAAGKDQAAQVTAEVQEAGQAGAPGPACTLHGSSMGGGSVVLAVSTQQHSRHLALQAAAFVRPLAASEQAAGSSAGTSAGASSSSGSSSSRTEADRAYRASLGGVQLLPGGGLAIGSALQLEAVAVRELWRRLKDGLAFPMLLAAYAEAGLQPPAGLLALPEELKQRLLGLLGAQDLASLCATCSELRHLGSADELWRPLFEREFPHVPTYFAEQARPRGFKWAYGQCWRERRRREDELRRARARAFMPAVPRFGVPRPPPFYPPPPGPGMPRIIGGDYDRLPQFGPGGGPGLPGQFFGAGGLAPGGGPLFGAGRRQGRGGRGGFRLS